MLNDRYTRQSFLGEDSQKIISQAVIGVIGLGGGGSHIVQQLAHIGFLNFVIFDPQFIEDSNLNRMVGAKARDVLDKKPKVEIAKRIIENIHSDATIEAFSLRWQNNPEVLKKCDIIFGCVDSFKERQELEIFSRRFVIPYIDIGMDVFDSDGEQPRMVGQLILSLPGGLCMRCLGFLDEEKLSLEASKYGSAGPKPQVVWANGVLASSAIGMAINLLTGWSSSFKMPIYQSYDGNSGTLTPHPKLSYLNCESCSHFPKGEVGYPRFKII